WAAGNVASPILRCLGAPLDYAGRAVVEPDCTIPGHPEVFVLGDAAAFNHQEGGTLPGVSPVAIQMGEYAARAIKGAPAGRPGAIAMSLAAEVKARAAELGFLACGITDPSPPPHGDRLDAWLARGYAGTMRYLHRQARRRKNPRINVPESLAVVVLLENYYWP